jgi:hypothetical protein
VLTLTVTNSTIGGPGAANTATGGKGGDGGAAGTSGSGGANGGSAGNGGDGEGGGFYVNKASAQLTNDTTASNQATAGAAGAVGTPSGTGTEGAAGTAGTGSGGGYFDQGSAGDVNRLINTIIDLDTAATDPDVHGTFTSQGHNIIGQLGTSTGFVASDMLGVSAAQLQLGPLQDNGGPTPTDALLPGSVAIDTGDNSVNATLNFQDQRGFPRPVDGGTGLGAITDIGAFEFRPPARRVVSPVTGTTVTGFSPAFTAFSPAFIVERAHRVTLVVGGVNFQPGSVVLVNGHPLITVFINGTQLLVPGFLEQVVKALTVRRGRHRHRLFDDGILGIKVLVPRVGETPRALFQVLEAVSPGKTGTPGEQRLARRFEDLTHQEADTSPVFQAILAALRGRL